MSTRRVNLKYAWDNYFNPRYVQTDSYFKIVGESVDSGLGDDTSMFLKVSDGAGIFYRREIELDARTSVQDDGTLRYVNLDSVWYGVQEVVVTVDSGEVDDDGNPIRVPLLDSDEKMITTNHLVIAPEPMNDFAVNPNPQEAEEKGNNICESGCLPFLPWRCKEPFPWSASYDGAYAVSLVGVCDREGLEWTFEMG